MSEWRGDAIGGAERPSREWEESEARRREERHAKRAQHSAVGRRAGRQAMSALELHRLAVERAGSLSTVPAGNVEPSRGGGDRAGPPRQQELDDDPRWREHWQVIRSRLERVHDLLDEAEGLGPVASQSRMLGAEKDRLILAEPADLSALAVVEKLGRDIAGSERTVQRIRERAAREERERAEREKRAREGGIT